MADLTEGLSAFFSGDHAVCDEAWAEVEAGSPGQLKERFARFAQLMDRHLRMEEEVLFPAFETATGMRGMGPTEVMRHEHRQMRALLSDIETAVREGRTDGALDLGDTLLMLIQQHNAKEEGMLYPMSEAHLQDQWEGLSRSLKAYGV